MAVIEPGLRAMLNAIRSVRNQPPTLFSSPLPYYIGRNPSYLSLRQPAATTTTSNPPQNEEDDDNMEQQQQHTKVEHHGKTHGDVMYDSFGDGYATRCEEEGFGGIYGRQDSPSGDEKKARIIHANHPEYGKNQGSEVKEKEKGRHQKEH